MTPQDGAFPAPSLKRVETDGVAVHTDEALRGSSGIVVAFSERGGGTSGSPYHSLNLAAHVGDDPRSVDVNRRRLLTALGVAAAADRVVTAQQVHGSRIVRALPGDAGAGAYASAGKPPIAASDAILTDAPGTPLLMMYADCVPVILVARKPSPMVAVVHAGWKGALDRLPGRVAAALAANARCETSGLLAYIGPHIRRCCYEVDEELLARFRARFGSHVGHGGKLDLGAAVRDSLTAAGVAAPGITSLDVCTKDHQDRFFSYRGVAETGRHGALAMVAGDGR